ncbi:MAG: 16S rRNA (guanine(527)-N(7))-methyltransferase RsmG [Alphaproteobacteria bacterium]|nr:16S rRNA (guanine(527)-N(7))-methyltransferase RsmG [Alphaproteobacteria bacterium]
MTDAFDAAAFQAETGVSRETIARFERWRGMLAETNAHTNLVGRSTLEDFWFRHALDSWQIYQQAPQAARWADLGAGAGFPGLAIAYGLMQAGTPGGHVTLVESVQKKAQFLKAVAAATGAPVTVLPIRVEALDEVPVVDVVTARAMAPLETLLGYMHPFVEKGARALLPKGAKHGEELTRARKSWTFDCEVIPSRTSRDAAILSIRELSPCPPTTARRHPKSSPSPTRRGA